MVTKELRARLSALQTFDLDGSTVILSLNPPMVIDLNERAEMVFALLTSGLDEEEIAPQLGDFFGLDPTRAEREVLGLIGHWEDSMHETVFAGAFTGDEKPRAAPALPSELRGLRCSHSCRAGLGGVEVSFTSNDRRMIDLLRTDMPVPLPKKSLDREAGFAVYRTGQGYTVVCNGAVLIERVAFEEFHSRALPLIDERASRELDYGCAIRASAAVRDGKGFVFPGPRGSGKTSVAGALCAAGYQHYGDDTAILDLEGFGIYPLPRRLAVREGSWETGASPSPAPAALGKVQSLFRFRQRKHASSSGSPSGNGVVFREGASGGIVPVSYLIFPEYSPSAPARLCGITKVDALRRLVTAGLSLRDHAAVEGVVEVVANAECFELLYSGLPEVTALIGGLA